jgi:hypothetical protein
MIDPYEVYKMYNALRLHFESDSYDAFKYNFKTSVKPASFYKRRDKYFFAKIGNKHEKNLMYFFVSNFISDVKYVGDMLNEQGDANFNKFKKVHESLTYNFTSDINKLSGIMEEYAWQFDDLFILHPKLAHPRIVTIYLKNEISLETLTILNGLFNFAERENITEPLIWPDLKRKIIKYRPFISYDKNKMMSVLKKRFT